MTTEIVQKIIDSARSRAPELAAVFLLLSALATALCVGEYRRQADAVHHTLLAKNSLSTLLSTLQDAETGQRGYLLSKDETFLEPYRAGTSFVAKQLALVRDLTQDNADQQTRVAEIEPLVASKLSELAASIDQLKAGGAPTVEQLRAGKEVMDSIRGLVADMRQAEDALLSRRMVSAQRFTAFSTALAMLTAILAVAAVAGWVYQSRLLTKNLHSANQELRDTIEQRDLAESKARHLQKLEAIGQLTGGIAHDFNNILAVIMAGLSLSQRRAKSVEEMKPFVNEAMEAARRGADLTRRLLAFARQQPLEFRSINVNRWVTDISEVIARAVGETIRTETVLASGIWPISIDPSQLQNAVLNIAVNARDAMPDGGKLTIETANCHFDDRYSQEHDGVPPGQYVMIGITDTGSGMKPDTIAKAFEPFYTTKPTGQGTGLGLSQVHGFVKQSKGHVKIYSEIGHGTTIRMYFPREIGATDEVMKSVIAVESLPRGNATNLVLVVEDDPRVRTGSVALLRELGYSVIHADGGANALAKLRAHPAIELLFTDVVMPEMNGRQLAEIALRQRPDLKVLYTTGFTKNAVVHGGVLDRGVNLLPKPFTIEELARKVHEVLRA